MNITPKVERKIAEVTLNLTSDEAVSLMLLCGRISGNPDSPIKQLTDKIYFNLAGHFRLPKGSLLNVPESADQMSNDTYVKLSTKQLSDLRINN